MYGKVNTLITLYSFSLSVFGIVFVYIFLYNVIISLFIYIYFLLLYIIFQRIDLY